MRGWLHPLPHQTLLALLGVAALVGAMGQWGYGVETTAAGVHVGELDWSGLDGGLGAATAALAFGAIVVALRPPKPHLRTLGALGLFTALFLVALSGAANGGSPKLLDLSLLNIRDTNLGWGLLLTLSASLAAILVAAWSLPRVAALAPRTSSLDGAGREAWRHPGTRGMAILFIVLIAVAFLPWARGSYQEADGASATQVQFLELGVATSHGLALLAASLAGVALLHAKLDARARSFGAALLFLACVALIVTFGPGALSPPEGWVVGSYTTGVGAIAALMFSLSGVVVAAYRALPIRVVAREGADAGARAA